MSASGSSALRVPVADNSPAHPVNVLDDTGSQMYSRLYYALRAQPTLHPTQLMAFDGHFLGELKTFLRHLAQHRRNSRYRILPGIAIGLLVENNRSVAARSRFDFEAVAAPGPDHPQRAIVETLRLRVGEEGPIRLMPEDMVPEPYWPVPSAQGEFRISTFRSFY